MKNHIIPVTSFNQNCSLVWCDKTHQGALIDPGGEAEKLKREVAQKGVKISQILLTHGHVDHVGAAVELAEYYQVPILGPALADKFWLESLSEQSRLFGLPETLPFVPTKWMNEGVSLTVGEISLSVLHCPGHTPGHVVFFNEKARLAWVGDVLFHGGVGRTDFPFGDHQTLIDSIFTKLLPLGDDVTFISGHGATSTFGYERCHNPFLRQDSAY